MSQIASPWLAQLAKRRPFALPGDAKVDVTIVGGGIAGMATAAYLLQDTKLSVIVVEAGRIAHGASGHNAGQLVADFERTLSSMIDEYGLMPAVRAQTEVEGAWIGVDWLLQTFGLRTPLYRCQGFAGYTDAVRIRAHLDAAALRVGHGLHPEPLLVAVGSSAESVLTSVDEPLVTRMPHSAILKLPHTDDPTFVAAAASPKGCMNSALFCEELAGSLVSRFPDRFHIAEHAPVTEVSLRGGGAVLKTNGPRIEADHVVMCTNGFESVRIGNEDGPAIDRSFHRMVQGVIGYMGGYMEQGSRTTTAVSYFRPTKNELDPNNVSYTYLTRRPYDHEGVPKTLLCIGGPERLLPEFADYDPRADFPADVEEEIDRAFRATYVKGVTTTEGAFRWHGVMGYTPTGIRCVGRDPRAERLLYNLGCNGVGILPSIAGGRRIAQILAGAHLHPSLFDPELQMSAVA